MKKHLPFILIFSLFSAFFIVDVFANPYPDWNYDGTVACTHYVWEQVYNNQNIELPGKWGHAGDWYDNAEGVYSRGQTPQVGAIACWDYKRDQNGEIKGYGHVAYVTEVYNDGSFYIIEGGFKGSGYVNGVGGRIITVNNDWPSDGFIYPGGSPTADIPEGVYYLRSALNENMVVGAANSSTEWGSNIQLEICKNAKSQKFHIVSYDGKYAIWNDNSKLAMDVENISSSPGANVQQYYYWPSETKGQVWSFEESGDGYYYIRSELGTYLDVYNGSAVNGQNIQTYTKNGTLAQKFKLELVEPAISISKNTFFTGDTITVEFGDWNGASSFEYYLAEFPEGFAYTTNTKHEDINWNSISFFDLSSGHYSIFVHARNKISASRQSNWITFDVYQTDYNPTASTTYNGHLYEIYDYEMSWTFAKDLCEQMGGHLVVVNDANESAFLNSFIDSGSKDAYWIGASNFLGTAQNQDGIWKWVTGEDLNYMNWHSGEPSSSGLEGEREHWAEIRKSYSYQWNDVNNTSKKNKGFILEIDSVEPTQYAVEFKSNGGSGTMASQTIAEGDNLILPACTFTAPDGKKFKAWNIAGNEYAVGASYKVTGNTVVTAVWEEAARKTQIISVSKTASGTSVAIFCSDANATVFCASYDVSGKMTDIESKPVSLGQNTYNFSFTTANSVKAFVLDAGYRPLCESGSR